MTQTEDATSEAVALIQQKRFEEALDRLAAMLEAEPANPDCGNLLRLLKDSIEAQRREQQIRTLMDSAQAAIQAGKLNEAEALANRLLELSPEHQEALHLVELASEGKSEPEEGWSNLAQDVLASIEDPQGDEARLLERIDSLNDKIPKMLPPAPDEVQAVDNTSEEASPRTEARQLREEAKSEAPTVDDISAIEAASDTEEDVIESEGPSEEPQPRLEAEEPAAIEAEKPKPAVSKASRDPAFDAPAGATSEVSISEIAGDETKTEFENLLLITRYLVEESDFKEAEKKLQEARKLGGDHPEIETLRTQVRKGRRGQKATNHRRATIVKTAKKIDDLLAKSDLKAAGRALKRAGKKYPDSKEIQDRARRLQEIQAAVETLVPDYRDLPAAPRPRRGGTFFAAAAFMVSAIGVILGIDGSIFMDIHGDWKSLFWGPTEEPVINLSDLMSEDRDAIGADGKSGMKLYVFALDVSGSMSEEKISKDDLDLFLLNVRKQGIKIPEECVPQGRTFNQWDLARSQLCCYLEMVHDGEYVGLWRFGTKVDLLSADPVRKFVLNDRNRKIEERDSLRAILMSETLRPRSTDDYFQESDFEGLLQRLHKEYIESGNTDWDEVHFIIVSDFIPDKGMPTRLSDLYSMAKIEDLFGQLGSVRDTMFHLATAGDVTSRENSVVHLAVGSLKWYQSRVYSYEKPADHMAFDFFYPFVESARELIFYYARRASPAKPIRVEWGSEMPAQSHLTIGLMNHVYNEADESFAIQVSEGIVGHKCGQLTSGKADERLTTGLRSDILRLQGKRTFEIKNWNNICLQPLSFAQDFQPYYRITLSREGDPIKKTFMVDLRFQRYLPPVVAWTLTIFCVALVVCLVVGVSVFLKNRKLGRT